MSQSGENPSQHPAHDSSAQGQPAPEWRPPMYSADAAAAGYGAAQPQPQPPAPGAPAPGTPAAQTAAPATPPAYMAPQEPRRRRVWPWVVSGLLIVMLLFGCIGTALMAIVNSGDGKLVDGDKIAVIPLQGVISGSSSGQAGAVSPEKYRELLQRAQDDDAVKAVVLRVDSPGGTVAASEEIATYVKELRKSKKPVVVSVGDVDASGAYMISSQADKIVANPGSAVGSIGVIMEVANASRLMDKIGLEFKVITAGKYKDAGSPFRPVTPEETAMLQSQIDEIYGQFIDIVAEGRGMPRSKVESLATGWAWSGTEAKKLGLVDEIGTYQDALDLAADLAKIDEYNVETYEDNDFGDLINLLTGVESFMRAFSASSMANPTSSQSPALAR